MFTWRILIRYRYAIKPVEIRANKLRLWMDSRVSVKHRNHESLLSASCEVSAMDVNENVDVRLPRQAGGWRVFRQTVGIEPTKMRL